MSAALPAWIEPSDHFDPLASAFMGRFVASLDYDARRELTARGGGRGGGGRSRRGGGRSDTAVLRARLRSAEKRATKAERAAEKARSDAEYAGRVLNRSAAARVREHARQLEKEARTAEAESKRGRRLLGHFRTPAKQRSRYQRRVVSGVSRQIERGEQPSIAGALGRKGRPGWLDPARQALAARLAAIGSGRGKLGMYLHFIDDATVQRLLALDNVELYNLKRLGNEGVTPPGVDPFAQLNRDFNETLGTTDYNYVGYNTRRKPVNPLWLNSGGTKKRSIYGMRRAS
jgi:hypothetical protein